MREFDPAELTLMQLLELVESSRSQGWRPRANCRGMAQSFTGASHEEQVSVCDGTAAPWMSRCPVREECLQDAVARAVTNHRELTDGNLVHGGLLPTQVRVLVRERKRKCVQLRESVQ